MATKLSDALVLRHCKPITDDRHMEDLDLQAVLNVPTDVLFDKNKSWGRVTLIGTVFDTYYLCSKAGSDPAETYYFVGGTTTRQALKDAKRRWTDIRLGHELAS